MKITEEQISKLKQLDRIEYRQKRDYLINKYEWGDWITIPYLCLITAILVLIMGKLYGLDLINTSETIVEMGTVLCILLVVINVIRSLICAKRMRELEEEYFKAEVK
jgi:small-conductance mechanosensitive channel